MTNTADLQSCKNLPALAGSGFARPGLSIQVASRQGLLPRLELIKRGCQSLKSVEARVAFAKRPFGSIAP
jgi:hypothetical protein